ncbi:MAG: hypothetical protein NC086_06545, partial [Alistipes sp.]|nr:hypothetical protein [Alistipes sp.]
AGFLLPTILHTSRKEKGRKCLKTPYLWAFIEIEGMKKIPEREKERGLELLAGGALGWRGGGRGGKESHWGIQQGSRYCLSSLPLKKN